MTISIAQGFGFEKEWLEDAFNTIIDYPGIFDEINNEEAQSLFGIGKNKVEALYTWLKSTSLIEKTENGCKLSSIGEVIKKYDPYFKREGTWWLIHILLSMGKSKVDLWNYYSNFWHSEKSFNRRTLHEFFSQKCPDASERSIKNGMNAVLSSMLDTPLTNLGILTRINKDEFIRKSPDVRLLHPLLVALAIVRWSDDYNVDSIMLQDLSNAYDSVGRILFLNQYNILIYLERISDMYERKILTFSNTAGYNNVEVKFKNSAKILEVYYLEIVDKMKPSEAIKKIF